MLAARPRGSGRHARDEPELHPEEGLPGATHNLRVACPHTQGTSRQEGKYAGKGDWERGTG